MFVTITSRQLRPSKMAKPHVLSPREREVTLFLSAGYNEEETGRLMKISKKGVDSHLRNVMRKLSIHNRAQLVQYAILNRIIRWPGVSIIIRHT